jgi:hypothetical protein
MSKALRMFRDTIEVTGGLIRNEAGDLAPAVDEDWIDLADAYIEACRELDVEPMITDEPLTDGNGDPISRELVVFLNEYDYCSGDWPDDVPDWLKEAWDRLRKE